MRFLNMQPFWIGYEFTENSIEQGKIIVRKERIQQHKKLNILIFEENYDKMPFHFI